MAFTQRELQQPSSLHIFDEEITLNVLTTKKQSTDEKSMCIKVRPSGYGKLKYLDESIHCQTQSVFGIVNALKGWPGTQ